MSALALGCMTLMASAGLSSPCGLCPNMAMTGTYPAPQQAGESLKPAWLRSEAWMGFAEAPGAQQVLGEHPARTRGELWRAESGTRLPNFILKH